MNENTHRLAAPLLSGLFGSVCLSGCKLEVLDSKGVIGAAESSLIATATFTMLLVVVPVILLTLIFAWRYRASNRNATYAPKWAHSTAIEVVVWAIPAVIILYLGMLTWKSTHELDPYKPIQSDVKPINVEVVALDWKWLFIYPDLGVASVNQVAFPVGTPVNFRITSDSVMNSFFIPQLGSQIYAMAGMQTQLHLQADHAGDYAGISANYSGAGFSDMKFRALAMSQTDFDAWVANVKTAQEGLDMNVYAGVSRPSQKVAVRYFSTVDSKLFNNIVGKYNNGNVAVGANCVTKG
ncbi:ubiquinol oxidase subunit II [Caballeronia sp. Lep1P3]|uniref:ubiquinol oxidase subunit II n=1 Tax=Caballeronia sp. Lep1P3 TaxID=2878150 RepID=UPI001FD39723|nr:ubiquinol oxidase subunit II [Caballeronia sp. Lep1P3]